MAPRCSPWTRHGDLPIGDIHVRDGAIVDVGPRLRPAGVTPIDAAGMVAMPGIVETHWHLWTSIARGFSGAEPERNYVPLIGSLGPAYEPEDQQQWIANGRAPLVTLGLAVRGPDASEPSAYLAEWEAARALGIPITMHAVPRAPTDAVQVLGAAGLLGPDVQLVHGICAPPPIVTWLTPGRP